MEDILDYEIQMIYIWNPKESQIISCQNISYDIWGAISPTQ